MKISLLSILALSVSLPAFAAKEESSAKVLHARKPAVKQKAKPADSKEEELDKSIAEINTLLRDSRMNPKSAQENNRPALLEDFKEELTVEQKQATLSTDDLAKDRGLQGDMPASAETELE